MGRTEGEGETGVDRRTLPSSLRKRTRGLSVGWGDDEYHPEDDGKRGDYSKVRMKGDPEG